MAITDRETESSAALVELITIYHAADADNSTEPLSGADVVDELGMWIERHRSLLVELGVLANADRGS